jgi:16S rRNA processing protein RimM
MSRAAEQPERVFLGRIVGVHGLKGWVKVHSWTRPPEGIFDYSRWLLKRGSDWQPLELEDARRQGKRLIAKLAGVDDRDAAQALMQAEVAVLRSDLPPLDQDEYYWSDLIGLEVVTVNGVNLGRVDHLLETGANDVLVVKGERERLIPFVADTVVDAVDLDGGVIRVDWDPDF